ncbi:hypothetical protein BH20ACI4_BH20ACI4_26600 [soil metagenome]
MIDLKEATEIAKKFLFEDEKLNDIHLETVLLSPDKERWEVVFSYSQKLENINDLQKLLGIKERKFYKKVIIDNESKQIVGYDNAYDKREAA